ncbi:MAG: 3-deoxy-manno-octulosonate-8-phosphatase [Arcobacter sp.]|nr:MAG: 3-deoxy-manno-octulosonate-8-phosphatase [Arcobacter sp.]
MHANLKNQAKKIKGIIFDVDGVLTDGGIIYDNNFQKYKRFNVKDGQIISHLRFNGFVVGAITGRASDVVEKRCEELKLDFHEHGVNNKLLKYENFKKQFDLVDEEIAYIGDDIIDLSVLSRVGLSACPADARYYIKENVDIVLASKGGDGAVRDLCDMILEEQGKLEKIIQKAIKGEM